MTSAPGWYPDPSDHETMRYWDGTGWTHVAVDGVAVASGWKPPATPGPHIALLSVVTPTSASVPPPPPPPVAPLRPVAVQVPNAGLPFGTLPVPKLSPMARLLFAGVAVAAVGTLLPWEQDTILGRSVTRGPSDVAGGAALLLGLLAAVVWVGWPARVGKLAKRRLVGLTVLAAMLSFFVLAKLAALGNAQGANSNSGSALF